MYAEESASQLFLAVNEDKLEVYNILCVHKNRENESNSHIHGEEECLTVLDTSFQYTVFTRW